MKLFRLVIISVFLFLGSHIFSQNLRLESIGTGVGYFTVKTDYNNYNGFYFPLELKTRFSKNLLAVQFSYGEDLAVMGRSQLTFFQFNTLYGRRFQLSKNYYFEPFAGVGYLHAKDRGVYSSNVVDTNTNNSTSEQVIVKGISYDKIVIPIQVSFRVDLSDHWTMGANAGYDIASGIHKLSFLFFVSYKW